MSEKLDTHELKMAFFDNGEPEDLVSFVRFFKMTIEASGILVANSKLCYLRTLIYAKALSKFDFFYNRHTYKPAYIGLRYIFFYFQCIV